VFTLPFVLGGWLRDGSELTSAGLEGWALVCGVLASTAIGSVAFNWGISRVPAVRASQLLNLTPVVGLLAAIVFLAESPSMVQYVGGGLVLLAVMVLVRAVEGEGRSTSDDSVRPAVPLVDAADTQSPDRAA
jgi:drug/metabolite transporter (DMT)-like permease